MLIDWFTVAAQIVNFLLLVWLLKRFLYRRILGAVDARETRIAASVANAEAKEKRAGEQLTLYQAKLQEFEQQQESMLARARLEAEQQRGDLLERAREDIRALEAKWKEDLERERKAFLTELRQRAVAEVVAIARRTVADLASLDAQECTVRIFLDRIRFLDEEACQNLAGGELLVRTAVDLPESLRTLIRQALEDRLQAAVRLRFETVPGLGLGLELRGNGWRVPWNSASYLEALEEDLRRTVDHNSELKTPAGVS